MGDYTKLIVNCEVKYDGTKEQLNNEIIENLGYIGTSAYHCEGELLEVFNSYHNKEFNVSLIAQKKYGVGIDEFLSWLKPMITQGCGHDEIYAFVISEYENGLTIHKLINDEDK